MRSSLYLLLLPGPGFILAQDGNLSQSEQIEVYCTENTLFRTDPFWRGADGAASVDLENGKILWLFSDSFIDPDGSGNRSNSKMINNSIGIQDGYDLTGSEMVFYVGGSKKEPGSFFELPGENWYWTGHGTVVQDKLIIFLFEVTRTNEGFGFEVTGWHVAVIDNPDDSPDKWNIRYSKGPDSFGVIVGSSAVLKDNNYVYAYGVKEPGTHEVYLLRFEISRLVRGDISAFDWWVDQSWTNHIKEEPRSSALFVGQTEFSVHYEPQLEKYIQIQSYGFGQASVGYRLADQPQGPWSEPVIFFTPVLSDQNEFMYSAKAHPELRSDGLLITYNVNNWDFGKLLGNEGIYFPDFINVRFRENK